MGPDGLCSWESKTSSGFRAPMSSWPRATWHVKFAEPDCGVAGCNQRSLAAVDEEDLRAAG